MVTLRYPGDRGAVDLVSSASTRELVPMNGRPRRRRRPAAAARLVGMQVRR